MKWIKESDLTNIRNLLVERLPVGDVHAFELIKLIKQHIQELDAIESTPEPVPNPGRSQVNNELKRIWGLNDSGQIISPEDLRYISDYYNQQATFWNSKLPVSNPMIEGEDIEGRKKHPEIYKTMKEQIAKRQDYWGSTFAGDFQTSHPSQPIVKGEGKWSDEDMRNAWNADMKHDPNGRRFDEWLANYKPIPSPEKQEEYKPFPMNGGYDTSKPDGIQGEKEHEYPCQIPFGGDCEVCNPKSLPDITEGEELTEEILHEPFSEYWKGRPSWYFNEADFSTEEMVYHGFMAGAKWLQSHQTTPPTDSKDRSKEKILNKHTQQIGNGVMDYKTAAIKAMQEYADQEVAKYKEQLKNGI